MNKIFDIDAKKLGDLIISDITGAPLITLGVIIKARYDLTIKDYVTQAI